MSGSTFVTAENLSKSYGSHRALQGVSLELECGSVHALVGPNGAGKTTLVSIICGLIRPDEGTTTIRGRDVSKQGALAEIIGYAAQDVGVYEPLTVEENIAACAALAGLRRRAQKTAVEEALSAMGLQDLRKRRVRALSGGEKRRVHIASALVGSRPLIILDEPTAGLDSEARSRVIELVKERADAGATVFYSTHYMPEVEQLDSTLSIIDRGRLVANNTVRNLLESYGDTLVELEFDGPAPSCRLAGASSPRYNLIRFEGLPAGSATVTAIRAVENDIPRLVSAQLIRPSLESVYLKLTGKRFDIVDRGGEDVASESDGHRQERPDRS